jgi:Tfp pilus assembly protein PilF
MSVIIDAVRAAQREKARREGDAGSTVAPVLVRLRAQPRRALNRSYLIAGVGFVGALAVAAVLWVGFAGEQALPAVPAVTSAILSDALADTGGAARSVVQQAATPDTTRRSIVAAADPASAVAQPRLPSHSSRTPLSAPGRDVPDVRRVARTGTLDIAVEAPRNSEAARLFSEAVAAHRAGALDVARPLYERVLAITPTDGDALNNLGVILSGERQFDRALELLRRATTVAPRNAGAWNNIGAVLREQGNSAEAISAFRQALAIDPAHLGARVGLAQQYLATNVPQIARDLLTDVLESHPSLPEAHYTLGQVHEQLGDRTAAIASYSAFIRYAPARLSQHVELVRRRVDMLAGAR